MRIYEIRKNSEPVGFARSFDLAKAIVKEDDPSARKINHLDKMDYLFSNNMGVHAIDIKPDKEGIISILNSLIEKSKPYVGGDINGEFVDEEDYFKPEPVPKPVQEVSSPVSDSELKVDTIVPAIAYKVDNMPWPKKGRGTCLHCKKEVGFSGGWPCVNPPDAICD